MEAHISIECAPLNNRKHPNKFNQKQWLTLICLSAGNIGVGTCSSLQAPFFPKEAELKGATPAGYGLVFGFFYLATFLFSPICGKIVQTTKPEYLRDLGILIIGVCFILFGFLDKSPPGATFLALAYVIRIAEGIGCAAFKTSNFIIIAVVFPDHMAMSLGTGETMLSLGIIIGPPVGSVLYEIGGYTLPFVSAGAFLLIIGLITFLALPTLDVIPQAQNKDITYWNFVKNPLVPLHLSLLIFSSSCVGFNLATLEPHLRQFHLSTISVGFVFIIGGIMYGITSPVWGYLADKRVNPKILAVAASLFIAVCFTFIGPVPFFGLKSDVRVVIFSMLLFGIGYGGTRVIAFVDCLNDALHKGLPNDIFTTGIISGTFTAAFGIGFFLGPTMGGILLQTIGYGLSSSVMALIMYLVSLAFVCYIIMDKCITNSSTISQINLDKTENQSLLESNIICIQSGTFLI